MISVIKLSLHSNFIRNYSLKNLISNKLIINSLKPFQFQSGALSLLKNFECQHFSSSSSKCFQENRVSKSLTVLDNVKQVRESPAAALVLGFAGLIPFVAAPSYIISSGIFLPAVAYAQLAYGASILSFIGGVRWGLTLPQGSTQSPNWHNLGYSVIPSLIAWGALLISPTLGSVVVMGGLGLTGYMDMAMWGYPNWFKGMRFCLTLIAVLSLWTTFMCSFILDKECKNIDSTNTRQNV